MSSEKSWLLDHGLIIKILLWLLSTADDSDDDQNKANTPRAHVIYNHNQKSIII